jgi:hypothetical protein
MRSTKIGIALALLPIGAGMIATPVHAEKIVQMPIDFVGDWCHSPYGEGEKIEYKLPSWTEGQCSDILSVSKWGWYVGDLNCDPTSVRLTSDTAPSGTAYAARITARCSSGGPVSTGTLRSFEFYRYKGNLTLTEKVAQPRRGVK